MNETEKELLERIHKLELRTVPFDEVLTEKIVKECKERIWKWVAGFFAVITLVSAFVGIEKYPDVEQFVIRSAEAEIKGAVPLIIKNKLAPELKTLGENLLGDIMSQTSALADSQLKSISDEYQKKVNLLIDELVNKLASEKAIKGDRVAQITIDIKDKITKSKPAAFKGEGFAYYGHWKEDRWNSRYFSNTAAEKPGAYPKEGDIVSVKEGLLVTARKGYIEFGLTGWKNKPSTDILNPTQQLRVIEVKEIGFSKVWIKFTTE